MPREEGFARPGRSRHRSRSVIADPACVLPLRGIATTPPCSETVHWIILTHPIEVDKDDIARFAKLYPTNARPGAEPRPALHSQFRPTLKTSRLNSFTAVLNMKAAKAWGLDAPLHLELLADELIE